MKRWVAHTTVVFFVGMILAGLASCGGNPGEDPVIKERFREIEESLHKVELLSIDIGELRREIEALSDDLDRRIRSGGTTATLVPGADLRGLRAELVKVRNRVAKTEADILKLNQGPKKPPVNLRTKTPTPPRPGKTPPARTPPRPTPTPKPRYIQYQAQKGDTVASIAEKFNVSVQDLMDANVYLKGKDPNAPLIIQTYWVPTK